MPRLSYVGPALAAGPWPADERQPYTCNISRGIKPLPHSKPKPWVQDPTRLGPVPAYCLVTIPDGSVLTRNPELHPNPCVMAAKPYSEESFVPQPTPPPPPPMSAASGVPPTAASAKPYLVRNASQQYGPYPLAAVHQYALEKRFLPTDIVWCEGMAAWEPLQAVLARHGMALPPEAAAPADTTTEWLIPVNRSPLALIAPYLGLFSVLIIPAPIALVVGILALRDLKKNPGRKGVVRAWFAIIAGGIGTIFLLFGLAGLVYYNPRQG
jgi:hypothetical protein